MSEVQEEVQEETANPYNARKSWHVADAPKS